MAAAVVTTLYAFSTPDGTSPTQPPAPPVLTQAPGEQKASPQIVIERAGDIPPAAVFECQVSGQRTYSDHRCGSDSKEHPLRAPNSMDSQDTGILSTPDEVLARSRAEHRYATEQMIDVGRGECSSIEDEKNSIDARMRKGYIAREGEWFRERLRVLTTRYYDLRCRHFH